MKARVETKKNDNCLSGMGCPNCRSIGPFNIAVTAWALTYDDGTDTFEDVEWDDTAACSCHDCGFTATVMDFKD